MPVVAELTDVVFIYVLTCYIPKIVMFYAYLGMFFTRRGGGQPRAIICKNRPRVMSEFPVPPCFSVVILSSEIYSLTSYSYPSHNIFRVINTTDG